MFGDYFAVLLVAGVSVPTIGPSVLGIILYRFIH